MGGFHLFEHGSKRTSDVEPISHEEDTPLHPLAAIHLYGDNTLDIDFSSFSVPTEAEIKDKGKSDWFAKSFVVLQTSWFVMQCIARGIKHLPVTHLEIVTLAYAAMNFVMYALWWNKPLNVDRPIRVFRKLGPRMTDNDVEPHGSGGSEPGETQPQPISEEKRNGLETILDFIVGGQDKSVDLSHEDRVPRFWANSTEYDSIGAYFAMVGVGVCFGAIHCIAWHFSFPTHAELLIWRVSCVAITAVPIYTPLTLFLAVCISNMGSKVIGVIFGIFGILSISSAFILYIVARVFTLVLAFTSLRDLPPGAFDTVHWTTFIPHI